MATIIIIQPDGTTETIERQPTDRPTLAELQGWVSGLIESVDVYLRDVEAKRLGLDDPYDTAVRVEAYVNEEGALKDLAPNRKGSAAVLWPVGQPDWISTDKIQPLLGPVVILRGFLTEEEVWALGEPDDELDGIDLVTKRQAEAYLKEVGHVEV